MKIKTARIIESETLRDGRIRASFEYEFDDGIKILHRSIYFPPDVKLRGELNARKSRVLKSRLNRDKRIASKLKRAKAEDIMRPMIESAVRGEAVDAADIASVKRKLDEL